MKKYINSEGEKQHFVGAIPEGWCEMTPNEVQQDETLTQKLQDLQELKQKKLKEFIDQQILADGTIPQEIKDLISV